MLLSYAVPWPAIHSRIILRHPLSSLLPLKTLSMPDQLTYYWFSLHHPFLASDHLVTQTVSQ